MEWASFKLHDNESLLEMVDPTIKRIISTRSLSSYSDIVSQCIQVVQESYNTLQTSFTILPISIHVEWIPREHYSTVPQINYDNF